MLNVGDLVEVKSDTLGILSNKDLIGKTGLITRLNRGIIEVLIDSKKVNLLEFMLERVNH